MLNALGAIVGGLVSGALQLFSNWCSRPRLVIDYEGREADKIDTSVRAVDGTSIGDIFVRARVRNTGHRTAKGALVFLTSLKELHSSGSTTPTSF